jgi:hypothetical protein
MHVWPPLQDAEDAELSVEEAKERKIMKLLLKVRGGGGKSGHSGSKEGVGSPAAAGLRLTHPEVA